MPATQTLKDLFFQGIAERGSKGARLLLGNPDGVGCQQGSTASRR